MPNWKRVIVSGSDAALNSLEITTHLTASGLIYPTTDGTENQSIITDGAGNLSFGNPSAGFVQIAVKNVSGGLLTKGTPVFITGSVGASTTVEIDAADASDASKMPAVGVLSSDLAINGEGFATTAGFLKNITTDPIDGTTPDPNDTIYVKAGGGLTLTKPTGDTNLIQNIGKVGKVSAANGGSIVVSSIMRSNDIPNLPEGKIWVGGTNYTVTSSIVDIDETAGVFKVAGDAEITGSLTVTGTSEDIIIEDGSLKLGTSFTQITALAKTSLPSGEALSLRNGTVYITGAGQMGIGTSSPDAELHVNGSARVTDTLYFNADGKKGIKTNTDGLVIAGTSSIQFQSSDATIGTQTERMRITANGISGSVPFSGSFVGDGSALTGITAEWDGSHNGDAEITGSLVISGSSADLTVTGNVGIGTTSPTARLNVKGSGATSATTALLVEDSAGTDLLKVEDGGNVGIGMDPVSNRKLAVAGTVLVDASNGVSGIMFLRPSDSATMSVLSAPSSGELKIGGGNQSNVTVYAHSTEVARFQSSGNVGIGTTSPSARLHISGSSTGDTVLIENNEGSSDAAPVVTLYRNSATPADGDYLGQLKFKGENDTGGEVTYAKITGKTSDVTNGTEDGLIETAVKKDGANVIVARQTGDALKLINGTGLEVDGTTTLGDLNLTDITVTGTASIAYLDVQFESASVIYSSGSNIFGDADDDVQTLNGDMVVNDTDLFVDASTARVGIGTSSPSAKLDVEGDINVTNANISNQENTDVDTGTEVVATLAIATYTAGFFDFVIKKGTNVRSGTIYACHDGTSVVHTETTTIDLGDTSDVDLAVDISGGNMRLTATVASDDWSVKSLVRGL